MASLPGSLPRNTGNHLMSYVNNKEQVKLEENVGILYRVAPVDFGWTGKMRIRYTDFQVREILPNGDVVHLTDYTKPQKPRQSTSVPSSTSATKTCMPTTPKESTISATDRQALADQVGDDVTSQLVNLDSAILTAAGTKHPRLSPVVLGPIVDKGKRTSIHQIVRQAFQSRIETTVDNEHVLTAIHCISQARGRGSGGTARSRGSQLSFDNLGGHYCHFTLYKENRDSMEAVGHIARIIHMNPSDFGVAGTKDKRAATAQRVSVFRRRPEDLNIINAMVENIKVGDFKFENYGLQLGDLMGNEFVITLKECQAVRTTGYSLEHRAQALRICVESSLKFICRDGFINYYGLQRFGTYSIGTHQVGLKILQSDFEGAVDLLLTYDSSLLADRNEDLDTSSPQIRDEANRAKACARFKGSKSMVDAKNALEVLPRRYGAENSVLRQLARSPNDYCGALLKIPRGLRLMYVHGYQSFVWNHMASKRWALFGPRVVEGDLVLSNNKRPDNLTGDIDQDGESVVNPSTDADRHQQACALTKKEADSGDYFIDDVVLPTPGWDIVYPNNKVGRYYKEFMGLPENGGLDPDSMRRPQKDFSLPGSYRKVLGRFIGDPSFKICAFTSNNIQLEKTDLDLIHEAKRALIFNEYGRESVAREQQKDEDEPFANPTATDGETIASGETTASGGTIIKVSDEKRCREVEHPDVDMDDYQANKTWIKTGTADTMKRAKLSHEEGGCSTAAPGVEISPNTMQKKIDEIVDKANNTNMSRVSELMEGVIANTADQHSDQKPPVFPDDEESLDPKLAVILKFKLHSSQYATMAIRDLTTTMPTSQPSKSPALEPPTVASSSDVNERFL